MNLLTITDNEYAILRHVEACDAWIPVCGVELDESAARHLVEANVLKLDGEGDERCYVLTSAGKALLRWGKA